MKKSKSRFVLCLVTSFIMAFTVIPYMGAGNVSAATGDTVTYTYTPTKHNPISKIILEEQSNGNYKVKACVKQSLFTETIKTISFIDADCAKAGEVSGLCGFSPNGDDNHAYYYISGLPWSEIAPGETKNLVCGIATGSHYEKGSYGDVLVNDWWNGTSGNAAIADYYIAITAPPKEATNISSGSSGTVTGKNPNTVLYTKTITAKKGQIFTATCTSGKYGSSRAVFQMYDSNSKVVSPSSWNNGVQVTLNSPYEMTFAADGQYTFKVLNESSLGSGSENYVTVNWTLKEKPIQIFRYQPFNAALEKEGTNKYKISLGFNRDDLYLNGKELSSGADLDLINKENAAVRVYRYDIGKGTLNYRGSVDAAVGTYSETPLMDKQYKYYIIKKFDATGLPTTVNKAVTFTDSMEAQLDKYGQSTQVFDIPKPVVATVKDFKLYVYKDVPKYRRLMWDNNSNGGVTGYIVKRYNSSGKLIKNYGRVKMSAPDTIGEARKYYVPYSSDPNKYTAYFTVTPYYYYNGKYYDGKETSKIKTKSVRIKAPTAKITKISNSKAKITINKASNSAGTIIYQYTGGKWKKIGSTTGTKYTVTYNKSKGSSKTPGKVKYKFKSYLTDNGSTFYSDSYSTSYSPLSNYKSWNYSKYQSDYKDYSHFWKPMKIYYSNGKVKLTGRWINTHNYRLDYFNIKVTVECDGKVIGTKTLKCGKMAANSTKTHSAVTISTKAGYDLRNGNTTITYKVISWY